MHDPEQLFVVEAISRGGIAESLNDYLEDSGAKTTDRLAPSDARLTDAVCREFATKSGDILVWDMTEQEFDEIVAQLVFETLQKLGFDLSDVDTL